jgi:hypothetical protein
MKSVGAPAVGARRENGDLATMDTQQAPHRPRQATAPERLRTTVFSPQFERLSAALVDSETRLANARNAGADPSRIELCEGLLDKARSAIGRGGLWRAAPREFFAWDCIAQFDRQMVHLVGEAELQAIWLATREEALEKLAGHRRKAVEQIIERVGRSSASASDVEAALAQVQTSSQNLYYKIGELRRQIVFAGVFLLVLIFCVLVATGFESFERFWPALDRKLQFGTLLGLVGGVLSVAFSVSRTDEKAKIPKLRTSLEVMLVRPLIGASLALPVVLLADSGLVAIGGITDRLWLVGVACFLAGFSERWFLGIVEGLEKRPAQPSGKEA